MKICPVCSKTFEPNHPLQKMCGRECAKTHARDLKIRRDIAAVNFKHEWEAWNRDFKLGKTVSNLGVS